MMDNEEDYDNNENYSNQAWELAQNSSINVLSDKDLLDYYVLPNEDKVVGAVFSSWDNGEYSFDVVVDDAYQNQGIGSYLTDIAIGEFDSYKEAYENAYINVEVVNPYMKKILENKGFGVSEETPIGVNMTRIASGYFCSNMYPFVVKKTPHKKPINDVMTEVQKLEKILSLLNNRFKIRKKPHSLNRLDMILSEDSFKEYLIPDMLEKVVEALESKNRRFEKVKYNKKRKSRTRGR